MNFLRNAIKHVKEEVEILSVRKIRRPQKLGQRVIDGPQRKRDGDPYRNPIVTNYMSKAIGGITAVVLSSAAYLNWIRTRNVA